MGFIGGKHRFVQCLVIDYIKSGLPNQITKKLSAEGI